MKVGVVHLGMVASDRLQEEGGVPDHQAVTGPWKGLNRRTLQGAFSNVHFEKEVQSCSFLWGSNELPVQIPAAPGDLAECIVSGK